MNTALLFPLFIIALITILFFTLCYHLINTTKRQQQQPQHGFKMYPFLGTLPEFVANRHRFLDWATDTLSPTPNHTSVFFRPGGVHGVITAYPPNVEHFLKTRFENYPKGPRFVSILHDFLGTGIFNSDGPTWRLQRKTASFEFNQRSLKNFVLEGVTFEIKSRLIPILKDASGSDRVLDLQDILERFAFDNVCKLAFGFDPGCLEGNGSGQSEFMRAFEEAAVLSAGRFMYVHPLLWKVKKFFNVGSEKGLKESIETVHGFADKIIQTRLEELSQASSRNSNSNSDNNILNYQDLLSRFMLAEESGDTRHDCNFLRDVVISFILAGRDTTSSGLSWFFWLLANHPHILAKIRSEVGEVRVRAGKQVGETYNLDELKEMNYLHGALSETLRLYPPVPVDTRSCLQDDTLPDGTKIKKGWFISYTAYAMGRIKSIWGEDCLEFRPERWIDENGSYKPYDTFKYPVFHAGPRICLGKEMAYLQMKSIAACVVEQFDVDVLDKENRPDILLSLTLRMKNGLPVKVKPRN